MQITMNLKPFPAMLLIVVGFAISGCATPVPVHPLGSSFDADQARGQLQPGTNKVVGSALMRQQGGGVVTCAGNSVALVPATDYAIERVMTIYGSIDQGSALRNLAFDPDVSAYHQLVHNTICDAQGFFEFADVADGEFFVVTHVMWAAGYTPQGGTLMKRVDLQGGQTVRVVLSP